VHIGSSSPYLVAVSCHRNLSTRLAVVTSTGVKLEVPEDLGDLGAVEDTWT